MMHELLSWITAHPGWVTIWLILVWFIVGECLDYKRGERF